MKTEKMSVIDRRVQEAEGIAEKVALNYMGQDPTDTLLSDMQEEYKTELEKAGLPEGLINIHLDQKNGSIFIFQPAPGLNERVKDI